MTSVVEECPRRERRSRLRPSPSLKASITLPSRIALPAAADYPLEHDPEKVADFSDKIVLKIEDF
jgi:hypothetical protein